jgi:hypothetical protein
MDWVSNNLRDHISVFNEVNRLGTVGLRIVPVNGTSAIILEQMSGS